MRFDLKKPCKDCPFLKGSSTQLTLAPGRIEEIVKDIKNDMTFQCHKTLDYYTDKPTQSQHCAGALAYHEKYGTTDRNFLLRLAIMLKIYEPSNLDREYFTKIIDEIKERP